MNKLINRNNIELLSPAGSFECVKVAVDAGADAIYMGGSKFSARAYAKSATEDKVVDSIQYVKQKGKKFYLTVNTLFKQKELKEIFLYLDPLVGAGVDAFIVQDLGVALMLKDRYKDVELHASTQMTITSSKAIKLVRDLGFTQVVLARELSLKEIKEIKKEIKDTVKLEAFVHGSMCYCYSGACLMSSFIGGESGNRGRCKGPCRLPYYAVEKKMGTVGVKAARIQAKAKTVGISACGTNAKYILSMKDMCALRNLKFLIDAGVTSFKIEGRMRQADYVEGVTKTYRKYIDTIIGTDNKSADGNSIIVTSNRLNSVSNRAKRQSSFRDIYSMKSIEKDESYLLELYNKGGFTNYFDKHNGIDMIQRYER